MNKSVFFAIVSFLVMGVSYYLNYRISDYPLTIYSPILMLIGYLPIVLIEKNVLERISNKLIKMIIKFHIIITLLMITVYLIVIVVFRLINLGR